MSKPSSLDILRRFKTAYMNFIDELIEQFPYELDLIIIRVFFEDQVPVSLVMLTFIDKVLPFKKMIEKREEEFFLKNNHLFSMLDGGKVDHFKKLWTSGRLDGDDKNEIWRWFSTFITLAEAYQKSL